MGLAAEPLSILVQKRSDVPESLALDPKFSRFTLFLQRLYGELDGFVFEGLPTYPCFGECRKNKNAEKSAAPSRSRHRAPPHFQVDESPVEALDRLTYRILNHSVRRLS